MSSSSLILERSSLLFKTLDANETGFQPLTLSCPKAAPRPEREALHFIRVLSSGYL